MTDHTPIDIPGFDVTFDRAKGHWRISETLEKVLRRTIDITARAEGEQVKGVLRSLGWIAPEDIAAHDAQVAAQALREARDMLANSPAVTIAGPGGALELLDAEIDRIEAKGVEG